MAPTTIIPEVRNIRAMIMWVSTSSDVNQTKIRPSRSGCRKQTHLSMEALQSGIDSLGSAFELRGDLGKPSSRHQACLEAASLLRASTAIHGALVQSFPFPLPNINSSN